MQARRSWEPLPIRRFKLRARHIRPFMPQIVRHFMARWHALAVEHHLKIDRERSLDGQDRLDNLHEMRRHAEAESLWRDGLIGPNNTSDDPEAPRVHAAVAVIGNLCQEAEARHPKGMDVMLDVIARREIRVVTKTGERMVGVFNPATGCYEFVVNGKIKKLTPRTTMVCLADGIFTPISVDCP